MERLAHLVQPDDLLESWIGEIAEPYGVTVHSVQAGPIDLATPSGQMVARQLGAVAQYESAIKAERLRSKMEQKADNGEWLGGPRVRAEVLASCSRN